MQKAAVRALCFSGCSSQGRAGLTLLLPRQVAALPASLGSEGLKTSCDHFSGSRRGFTGHEGGEQSIDAGISLTNSCA